jgi:hypothetical protein
MGLSDFANRRVVAQLRRRFNIGDRLIRRGRLSIGLI